MNDLKDLLSGGTNNEIDKKLYEEQLDALNNELIIALPVLRQLFNSIKEGNNTELETRNVTVAVPPLFWQVYDKVIEIFKIRDQFGLNDIEDPNVKIQESVSKLYKTKTNIDISEILVSQLMLDTILSFAIQVASADVVSRISEAIKNNDMETVTKLLEGLAGDINELDNSDDDSETWNINNWYYSFFNKAIS